MNRSEMLKNLHELDKRLWTTLDIEIVGASSAILQKALKRSSGDIDVLNSSFPLNHPKIRQILDAISENPNERESWLNQSAREDIMKLFPNSYKFDTAIIVGEEFKRLHPKLISKADFVICKLLIEEDKRRLHDLTDIKNLIIEEHDVKRIYEKFNDIANTKQSVALKAEGLFKQLRQEFCLNKDGLPYSNSEEIADYSYSRYGISAPEKVKEQWSEEIDRMIKRPEIIIGEIDYNAGKHIEAGNTLYATKDRSYRVELSKVNNYGLEL